MLGISSIQFGGKFQSRVYALGYFRFYLLIVPKKKKKNTPGMRLEDICQVTPICKYRVILHLFRKICVEKIFIKSED